MVRGTRTGSGDRVSSAACGMFNNELRGRKMESFEIMYNDLTEEAQQRFLEFQGLDCSEDGNYEYAPLAIINKEEGC